MTRLRCLHHHRPTHQPRKSHRCLHLIQHSRSSSTRLRQAKTIRGLLRRYRSGMPLEQGRNLFHRMSGWDNSIGISVSPPDVYTPDHNVFSVFAQCARGNHDETTSFGLCGIICAILLFPIGLIFLWYAMMSPA
jgi:hypothetical protein